MKKNNSLDIIKLFACLLIIGSHCLPLINPSFDYYFGQWGFRWSVPFFFLTSGYYFSLMDGKARKRYIKRILIIYLVSMAIYLPLYFKMSTDLIYHLVFGYGHLWYLSALFFSLIILDFLDKAFNKYCCIFIVFLLFGALFDEYYKLIGVKEISNLSEHINIIGGSRHALFFALPLLLIGRSLSNKRIFISSQKAFILLPILVFLAYLEAYYLRKQLGNDITLDVSLFGWTPSIPIFILGLNFKTRLKYQGLRLLRKTIDVVYIIHIWVIIIVNKVFHCSYIIRFIVVSIISFIISLALYYINNKYLAKLHFRRKE